jgi:N4-(beta-N-acetylglucosaminyl)-L-asparaginase
MRRRDVFLTAAGMPLMAQGPAGETRRTRPRNIVISSANGLAACKKAFEVISAGGDTLEAVVQGVTIVEDDPNDTSVGYGGLPNEECVVELDASVMHGPTRRCGAVASVQRIKNVSRLAKLVMDQTDHVMLVGQGATHFASLWGIPEIDLLTERARIAWMAWKQSLRDADGHNNWIDGLDAPPAKPAARLKRVFPDASDELIAWALWVAAHPPTGTINCLALNSKGEISGTTTTSGLAWKIPGRVGDSPIIGAGLYVDQAIGAAGSTGRGEENIRIAGAHTIVENMRHGMSPSEAALDALKRIAQNFSQDPKRLTQFDINFYALRSDGVYAGAALWDKRPTGRGYMAASKFAVNDGGETRLEECVYLLKREG